MVRIYITKWVLHRGILSVDVENPDRLRTSFYKYAYAQLPGPRFSAPLRMGVEAFLTLEEAQADAQERFEKYRRHLNKELEYVKRSISSMKAGNFPKVHEKFKRVADCKAYG